MQNQHNYNYQVIKSQRRTIALEITKEGVLIVRVPHNISKKYIQDLIEKKKNWIIKHLEKIKQKKNNTSLKNFVDGENILFLGKNYNLRLVDDNTNLTFINNEFLFPKIFINNVREIFINWYINQAYKIITQRINYYAPQLNFKYQAIKINQAQKRWGSCSYNGNLNFTYRLVMAPLEVVDYVVVHELSHLEIKNHSQKFWNKVQSILPDYKIYKKWLRENENLLNL